MDTGSKLHRVGSSIAPSFTPSLASQASRAARCSAGYFAGGMKAGCVRAVFQSHPAQIFRARLQMREIVRGIARHDAVEILGIELRLGESLAPSVVAAIPVRVAHAAGRKTPGSNVWRRPSSRARPDASSRPAFQAGPSPICGRDPHGPYRSRPSHSPFLWRGPVPGI